MYKSKKSTDWLFLGSFSLALSGILSIIIVFARVPIIQDFFKAKDLFKTALVLHVDLSQIFWFLTISIALSITSFGVNFFINNIFKKITFCTIFAVALSFFIDSTPILSNYIPFLDDNLLFSFAIALFLSVILIINGYLLFFRARKKLNLLDFIQLNNQFIIIVAFTCLFLTIFLLDEYFPQMEYYEYLFWGFGHLLQYSYCFIFIYCIFAIANFKPNFIYSTKAIILIHSLFALLALTFFIYNDITNYKLFFTKHMYLSGISPSLLLLLLILNFKNLDFKEFIYAKYYLITSILLFLSGGFISLFINESNTIIPAHYHGSIVAITIAIIGYINLHFVSLSYLDPKHKLIKIIPICYFTGQFLHISGLAISGGYGALRKSPDSLTNFYAKFWMGIMGLGGLIAIISGLLFIYICYICFRKHIKR